MDQKKFEKRLKRNFTYRRFKKEEYNELFQLYIKLNHLAENLTLTMDAVRGMIFILESVYQDNIDYLHSLDTNYSSDILSNKLLRRYNIEIVADILKISMQKVSRESFLFFEGKDPVLWSKKLDFYKLKLKKICNKKIYMSMVEIVDELYTVLVKLHFDLKCPKKDNPFRLSLTIEDKSLIQKLYGDENGNFDESFILSDFYFDEVETRQIILNYDPLLLRFCKTNNE